MFVFDLLGKILFLSVCPGRLNSFYIPNHSADLVEIWYNGTTLISVKPDANVQIDCVKNNVTAIILIEGLFKGKRK